MSIVKLTNYHGDQAIKNTKKYIEDENKTSLYFENTMIKNAIGYAENELKTGMIAEDGHKILLISGHNCKTSLAVETFQRCADQYYRNGHSEHAGKKYRVKTLLRAKLDANGTPILDKNGTMIHDKRSPVYHDSNGHTIPYEEERINQARSCYMWVIAFPPPEIMGGREIDPRLILQIAEEFMCEVEKEMGMEFPAVISVHLDKHHKHAHIVQSAYALSGHSKYLDTMQTLLKAREIGDRLSLKYDLPIIMEPGNYRSMTHAEWELVQNGSSWKETIRQEISYHMERSKNYTEFLTKMKQSGFDYRETEHHITYYTPGKNHRCRDTNLGVEYTKDAIMAYYNKNTLEKYKTVQRETVDIIDPTLPENQKSPMKIYISRYTQNGRRRSDLEMLLIRAIKILKLFKDKFSDIDNTDNPIRKSFRWKIQQLSEAIAILETMHIHTRKELDEKLSVIGATYSHTKKDFQELAQGKEGLLHLKELCENIKDLQTIINNLGITDFYLTAPTKKEIAEHQAKLFPMTPTQRRELFLALQDRPLYKTTVKYDTLTYSQAHDCINFLKGKTDKMPPQLITIIDKKENLDLKYLSIAEKTLEGIKKATEDRTIPTKLEQLIESFHLPVDVKHMTFSDAIHIAAYYKSWKPNYMPCQIPELLLTEAQMKQLYELLNFTKRTINIPLEQLSKKDADTLFRDLTLSMIVPDCVKASMEKEWNQSLSNLSYEEREYAEEYRNLICTIEGLGYDLNQINNVLTQVTTQLEYIQTEEKKLKELSKEYSTVKQLKMYTTLSETKQFTHGPKWKEKLDPDITPKYVEKDQEPEEIMIEKERKTNRKTFEHKVNMEF